MLKRSDPDKNLNETFIKKILCLHYYFLTVRHYLQSFYITCFTLPVSDIILLISKVSYSLNLIF